MFDPVYVRQVDLLLRCLPEIGKHPCFAIKGGTAINLFVRPLPRLSVDIDLTYLPLCGREEALADISRAVTTIAGTLTEQVHGCRVHAPKVEGHALKLVVAMNDVQIKVEPNHVLRGSVYPPESRELCAEAQQRFEQFVVAPTLSIADLYGGKICAALDRQHPRDLFDIMLLLQNEGLTPEIRRAFVVYLASHDKPMHELLQPRIKDIGKVYASEFAGMAREEVAVPILRDTLESLVSLIHGGLEATEKQFLLSLKQGEPDWDLLGIPHLRDLPGLQWKLKNIRRMDQHKRAKALAALQRVLEV